MIAASSAQSLILLVASPFIGSFIGLMIERLPEGKEIVFGRSACRNCGAVLRPLDLVPFLSWLALRGRCRYCGTSLGWFHPAVEFGAVVVTAWSISIVPGWLAIPTMGLGWALLALAVIDWRHLILPDVLTLPLAAVGLAISIVLPGAAPLDHVSGAIAGAVFMVAIAVIYERMTGREGLGFGDAKLFAAAGAWLGWQGLPSVLLIGATSALISAVLVNRLDGGRTAPDLQQAVPFGPFLAFGFWVTWLYGPLTLG